LEGSFTVSVIRRLESYVEYELGTGAETTKVQLAYDSPYRFGEPLDSDLEVKVNGYQDIVTDKLLAFFGRAEPRDAIDLFLILEREDIWELIRAAAKKDPGFDLYWLAVCMGRVRDFPDDISRWPVVMIKYINPRQLKEQLLGLVEEIMTKIRASGDREALS
jgi:hypothetical protein